MQPLLLSFQASSAVEEILTTQRVLIKAPQALAALSALSACLLEFEIFNSELMTLHWEYVGRNRSELA